MAVAFRSNPAASDRSHQILLAGHTAGIYQQRKSEFIITSGESVGVSPHCEIARGGDRHALGLEVWGGVS